MHRLRHTLSLLLFLTVAVTCPAQDKQATQPTAKATRDVDPLALDVLHAVTQPIEQAQTFSFKALISEEEVATNGQIVTFFHTVDVRVQRPDKVHLILKGRGQRVDFYGTKGAVTMYAPDVKLYMTKPAKSTIDENLADLTAKGVDMPIAPFLRSDLYERASKMVVTGYVIGRVKIFDEDAHQLAFTSPDADWQLWATGGESPRIVRVEVVNKRLEGKPRTHIQFLDWNLNPTLSAGEFTFTKPDDAHEIGTLSAMGGK